jgi:hypothetical protein
MDPDVNWTNRQGKPILTNSKVLISTPLKWHPSLIVQIKRCLKEGEAIDSYWKGDIDSFPQYNFVGVVNRFESGGSFMRTDGREGETGFEYVDRTEGNDDGLHYILKRDEDEITMASRAFQEVYESLLHCPFPWIVEEKANGKNFFCMWDWKGQNMGAAEEVTVIQFMAEFVARVKGGSLLAAIQQYGG